jgi:hypothetical protein
VTRHLQAFHKRIGHGGRAIWREIGEVRSAGSSAKEVSAACGHLLADACNINGFRVQRAARPDLDMVGLVIAAPSGPNTLGLLRLGLSTSSFANLNPVIKLRSRNRRCSSIPSCRSESMARASTPFALGDSTTVGLLPRIGLPTGDFCIERAICATFEFLGRADGPLWQNFMYSCRSASGTMRAVSWGTRVRTSDRGGACLRNQNSVINKRMRALACVTSDFRRASNFLISMVSRIFSFSRRSISAFKRWASWVTSVSKYLKRARNFQTKCQHALLQTAHWRIGAYETGRRFPFGMDVSLLAMKSSFWNMVRLLVS